MAGTRCAIGVALTAMVGWLDGHAVVLHKAGDHRLELTGNLQWDFGETSQSGGADEQHGLWRRRRLGLIAAPSAQVELLAEYDFAAHAFTDAMLKWKTAAGQWQFGQFKQPFLLDELTSDKRTLLLEPGLPQAFALSRRLGVGWLWNPQDFGLHLSAFDGNLDGTRSTRGGAARAWWTPERSDDGVWHFGLAATAEDVTTDALALSARAESRLQAPRAARLPTLTDASTLYRQGFEVLWLSGAWYGQGEFARQVIGRELHADFVGDGWYLQLGRAFGAGRRSYKGGTVQAMDAGRTFEIGLRFSGIELEDGAEHGGEAHTAALAATWYLQPETRVQANLVDVHRSGSPGAVAPPDFRVLEMRLQWVF
jgi:phosphate-selective porin OprO and OprP